MVIKNMGTKFRMPGFITYYFLYLSMLFKLYVSEANNTFYNYEKIK